MADTLHTDDITADVCIAGGGPAGIMLGLLLARAGIDVVVLEKHADFFRDFRGDTVHPSTVNLIDQLGIRAGFDAIAHTDLHQLDAVVDGIRIHAVDFDSLPRPNRAVALMPQWDLLTLFATTGQESPTFTLIMGANVTDVMRGGGRVTGVTANTSDGMLRVNAPVTIAADGRDSVVRSRIHLTPRDHGVPVDVLWFRVPRPTGEQHDTLANIAGGIALITIPRPDYLQCGMLIRKGSFDRMRSDGLPAFRERIARAAPRLRASAADLTDWKDVKLLSVQINRLKRWWVPGALCIGDAAHAMSPAFGVGINYAIQDAVATANLLAPVLQANRRDGRAVDATFRKIQRRRALPTALMQGVQRRVHALIDHASSTVIVHNPPTLRERVVMRLAVPIARPLIARLVGYGFRPERIAEHLLKPRAASERRETGA